MLTEGVPCSKHWELRETENNPFPPATPGIGERVGQWELLVQRQEFQTHFNQINHKGNTVFSTHSHPLPQGEKRSIWCKSTIKSFPPKKALWDPRSLFLLWSTQPNSITFNSALSRWMLIEAHSTTTSWLEPGLRSDRNNSMAVCPRNTHAWLLHSRCYILRIWIMS